MTATLRGGHLKRGTARRDGVKRQNLRTTAAGTRPTRGNPI
jgi:hypothetical protein